MQKLVRIGLASSLGALALVGGGARAGELRAPVAIDSVTIQDGVAIVSGVAEDVGRLEVNGERVDVSDTGSFVAGVDLDAEALVLSFVEATGELVSIKVPIDVLVENEGDVLDDLLAAGVSIDVPVNGIEVVDGQWSLISGRVLNDLTLASLTVNGVDVLGRVGPLGNFAIQLPWTNHPPSHATFVIADRRGVSQTTRYRVRAIRSVVRTRAGLTVSAAGARGLVIAGLRFDRRRLAAGRLDVRVTVADRRGYLVRGAAVMLAGLPAKYLSGQSVRTGFTNGLGRAWFTYRLRPRAFAGPRPRHLIVVARATPSTATATRRASLRLPIQR